MESLEGFTYSSLVIENRSLGEYILSASGLWRDDGLDHRLSIFSLSLNEQNTVSVARWINEIEHVETPDGYRITGLLTEVYHHEPYGVIETKIEALKLIEENEVYDWYDITISQTLTPGANISSDWEWNWLTYTMNGTYGEGNIMLSDYDPPPSHDAPKGIFTFLWRILGFDLRDYLPWTSAPEPILERFDLSDFSTEVYKVRYRAPRGYEGKDNPLEVRHHYVCRVDDGEKPVFWHQTQVEYAQRGNIAQVPYMTEPLSAGYITVE